ncbi:hypothetical protein SISSUDRAFT_1039286 [Sistotremastrum suecicum HHB10207 ss-3]|uniref:WD40 repeat-like protein n=1 Tax=Sistotremastrum suecicum HHB10207 ss-3 TaxID=1314776 RepID=A0A166ISB0_9AGAM|nr:hypothetical protein SISSUDRAFT_1039286 [Sistotremastrum suecicum HHB10207 ss-3]
MHGQFQERLRFEPYPFEPATSVFDVPAGSKNPRRLVKAWGHSVSKGPVWELLEDRAWFKEAHQNDIEEIGPFPRVLRPCVYQGLAWENMWEAMEFDPQRTSTWIPQSVPCAFGHFGEQTEINLAPLHSVNIYDFIPDTLAVVFNTGAPVGSVDWCPLSPDFQASNSFKQFLAVAILPSADYQIPVGLKVQRPHAGQLQIWSLEKSNITGLPVIACDMVLELDCGPALDLKWCPLPSHGQDVLGLVAGTFQDGSLSIFPVPAPDSYADAPTAPTIRMVRPAVRIEIEETACLCFDWANSEVIAVGCTNGYIAIFDVREAILGKGEEGLIPLQYIFVHQSAIRNLTWILDPPTSNEGTPRLAEDPCLIISVGFNGVLNLTDLREQSPHTLQRIRDVPSSLQFSYFAEGVLVADSDYSVKCMDLTLGGIGKSRYLLDTSGPIMSIGCSALHAHLAAGSADGSCHTRNLLKTTKRGLAAPISQKIFQLDYSRTSRQYRMLENFLPQDSSEKFSAIAAKRAKTAKGSKAQDIKVPPDTSVLSSAWSPEVSVTCVRWNDSSGFACAPWLASSTNSGLCRVDWLKGRFNGSRIPYGSVEAIRADDSTEILSDDSG